MTKRRRIPGVELLSGGEFRIRVRVTDPRTGRRVERDRLVRCEGLQAAEQARLDLVRALEKQLQGSDIEALAQAPQSKLGGLASAWLDKKLSAKRPDGSGRLTPNTQRRYRDHVEDFIVPFFGDRTMERLTK